MDQRLFDDIIGFPDNESEQRYNSLVGVDDIKERLMKESELLLNPRLLAEWSIAKHGKVIPLVKLLENRHALYIFAGDVGTGKTTLAESFGNHLALAKNISINLFRLSLKTRGDGTAGEMTKFVSQAFHEIKLYVNGLRNTDGTYASACILMIDEADALAQNRDFEQMHHEDRAGVNSIIQGIDAITKAHLPVLIVMCTNRLSAIDPAVRRRAAAIFTFERPNAEQLFHILKQYLDGAELTDEDLKKVADALGPTDNRHYGYTYSDIIQNLLPALVLDTYPDKQITMDQIMQLISKIPPTPPIDEKNKAG